MAPVAIALWSIALKPGDEPISFIPQSDLRITGMALGDELADVNGRTTVKLTYQTPVKLDDDDEEEEEEAPEPLSTAVLGSLTPGKIEQSVIDIILEEDEEYLFEVVGKNTVHLTGNYIDQVPTDNVPFNSDDEDEQDSDALEEAYDLRDVSSDVEVDLDEAELDSDNDDAGRFEEIKEESEIKTLKRPRDSDTMDVETEPLSKSAQKKLNKKLKAEGGEAVASGTNGEQNKSTEAKGEEKKGEEKRSKKKKEKKERADGADSTTIKKNTVRTMEGGLKVEDAVVGTGPTAKKGSMVSMRYIGKLTDGTIFDKNVGGKAFNFNLGKGEVIKGWDLGIVGMQVGGERLLTIPAPLAYGKKGSGKIPPNATLNFEVKLLAIR